VACFFIYRSRRFKSKTSVLYITSATYVAFVAFMSGSYSYTVNVSDWMQLRSPNMFIFEIYFYAMPLVSLIFMGLPFVSTFEVMSLATLGFLVIVPLVNPSEVGNAWVLFESKSVYRYSASQMSPCTSSWTRSWMKSRRTCRMT